eukprot:3304270-Rhodomonas_salina.1
MGGNSKQQNTRVPSTRVPWYDPKKPKRIPGRHGITINSKPALPAYAYRRTPCTRVPVYPTRVAGSTCPRAHRSRRSHRDFE